MDISETGIKLAANTNTCTEPFQDQQSHTAYSTTAGKMNGAGSAFLPGGDGNALPLRCPTQEVGVIYLSRGNGTVK